MGSRPSSQKAKSNPESHVTPRTSTSQAGQPAATASGIVPTNGPNAAGGGASGTSGGFPESDFWIAGAVQWGEREVPLNGPFKEQNMPTAATKNKIMFSNATIDKVLPPDFAGLPNSSGSAPLYARAFFPHCLASYSVGWAMLELSPEHPHYNCKKQRERIKEKERMGVAIDYSRRRKYFIYPERVSEIGLFLYIGTKRQEKTIAVSNSSWSADPIPGAFFTFSPDHGSIFGENSMQIPLRCRPDDPLLSDKRWLKLSIEFDRLICMLSTGNHPLKFEIRYRYGNAKFTAWRGTEPEKGVFRYSDEDRSETAISEVVASGTLTLNVTANDQKACKISLEAGEAQFAKMDQQSENNNLPTKLT